ncbi:unnamed protein product [Bursaphelenchus okinawaensis]|uniref:Uncharacterized protein n=1 Tax=Bursaphelenchus okinawaensis TaxID=465554 RepID=A0A811JQM3_9BILA|nr:unnamed protein product [Bursaphelenchus okinawaensis]CAG9077808.1 unnamed protein product [Bursaphelenchus okinawaensis]
MAYDNTLGIIISFWVGFVLAAYFLFTALLITLLWQQTTPKHQCRVATKNPAAFSSTKAWPRILLCGSVRRLGIYEFVCVGGRELVQTVRQVNLDACSKLDTLKFISVTTLKHCSSANFRTANPNVVSRILISERSRRKELAEPSFLSPFRLQPFVDVELCAA